MIQKGVEQVVQRCMNGRGQYGIVLTSSEACSNARGAMMMDDGTKTKNAS